MNIHYKNRIGKALSCAFIMFVFLLAMEVSARIDDMFKYGAPFFSKYTYGKLLGRDENYIRYNVPHSHFEKWKINNLGFRGHDVSPPKPKGTLRVFCMGSSETFGLYEDKDKEWPSQLSSHLEGNFQVMNSSVTGQFLDRYEPYIERYVLKWEPDIIILHLNFYSYSTGIDKSRTLKKNTEEGKESITFKQASAALISSVFENVRLTPKIKQTIKKLLPRKIFMKYETWQMQKEVTQLERKLTRQPSDYIDPENLKVFRKDLKDLITYLQDKGIKVVLSSYPSLMTEQNINTYPHVFLDARRFCIKLSFKGMMDAAAKFNDEIKSVAEECGAFYVDIDSALPKNMDYFGDNIHYTNQGAKVIAAKVAESIKKDIMRHPPLVSHYSKKTDRDFSPAY